MVRLLEQACSQSMDPPDAIQSSVVSVKRTGKPGRPRIEIDRAFLDQALALRGPHRIGPLLKCNPRTVRRRALEYGMVAPGSPVKQTIVNPDGAMQTVWTSTTPPMSTFTDGELDRKMGEILQMFPYFGRRMIAGTLLGMGHRVSENRIREAYVRVWGAPAVFGSRPIVRKAYWVPGVNSLWHHDGNHGQSFLIMFAMTSWLKFADMIRWRFVTHGFIDGKSRFVVAAKVNNNNRKETVLDVFIPATRLYGWPSRMRGDHGVENGLCADAMEEKCGPGRGSYIWGR